MQRISCLKCLDVYSGIAGGSHYSHTGGGGEYVCLPNNPKYDKYQDGKSRSPVSSYRLSGSGFGKTFKSRSRIFKQGSRRLGESRILPFYTPYVQIKLGRVKINNQ